MTIHFPPVVEELLDCKYEWCGRTGSHGFKREDHRKDHYRKVHMKVDDYSSKKGKGGRSGGPSRRELPDNRYYQTSIITDSSIVSEATKTPVQAKAAHKKPTLREKLGSLLDNPPLSKLSHDAVAGLRSQQPLDIPAVSWDRATFVDPDALRSKALDASGVESVAWTATTSEDVGMVFSEVKDRSSCSDDESMLERSKEGILDDLIAPIGCEKRHLTETIFNENETTLASMSHHSTDNKLDVIRSQIFETLFTSEANQQHYASLKVDWDILAFLEDQFHDQKCPHLVLGSVITITGSAQHAQATTCLDYVRQNWAAHGSELLDAIQDALGSPNQMSNSTFGACSVDGNMSADSPFSIVAELQIYVDHEKICLNIKSRTPDIILDVVQQLAWMGAALRTSTDDQIRYCEPKLEQLPKSKRGEAAALNITFEMSSLSEEDQSCWLPLFANPVIARGFPVPERKNGERGLEVPLEIMAALGGARHAMDFEGGLVLKGYSTLFIPIKRYQNSVQWHLICAIGENRVSFSEVATQHPNRALLEELNHDELKTTRTFLGLWKVAETHLATTGVGYDVDWSKSEESGPCFRFTGGTLGFSKIFTAQMSFVLGAKDGPYHHSQQGPFQKIIDRAEKLPVVLYDQRDRRAWLVLALPVILHMIQLRHHIKPFVVDGKTVQISPLDPSRQEYAAREAVAKNKSKKLFDCETDDEKDYCFRDAILDYWSILDGLMEREATKQATSGKEVHMTLQPTLYGWEFRDVVGEERLLKQKAQVLKTTAGRWYDLVKGVGAVVLFASGFGDIIRPTSESAGLCRKLRHLPKHNDYLAVCVSMLETFYAKAGHRQDHQYLTSAKHGWHRGSMLFEHCTDVDSDCCNCDRLQQVYHDSYKVFRRWKPPGSLEANGCVVFGQAHYPFQPRRSIDMRHNAVHMLPNTPIQTGRTNRHSPTENDCLLSPPPAASVSPEPEKTIGHVIPNSRSPPSPLHSTDYIVHDKTISLKRKPKMSHMQRSGSIIRGGHDVLNDEDLSSEDYLQYPTEHHSLIEHDTKSQRQGIASIPTDCASVDEYEPAHVPNSMRREAKIEHYGYPCGRSCTACLLMDCKPPNSLKMIGTITGAPGNSMNTTERREGQPV